MGKRRFPAMLLSLVFLVSACNGAAQQTTPEAASVPSPFVTTVAEPVTTPRSDLPQSEAEVPRISVEEAKAALDSGAAVIVDVRSAQSFATSHIAGALSIPLAEIELNPTGLTLDKDQWIITYCT